MSTEPWAKRRCTKARTRPLAPSWGTSLPDLDKGIFPSSLDLLFSLFCLPISFNPPSSFLSPSSLPVSPSRFRLWGRGGLSPEAPGSPGVMSSLGGFPPPGTVPAGRLPGATAAPGSGLGIPRGQFSQTPRLRLFPGPAKPTGSGPARPRVSPPYLPAARRQEARAAAASWRAQDTWSWRGSAKMVWAGTRRGSWGRAERVAGREGPGGGEGRESGERIARSLPSSSPQFKGLGCVSKQPHVCDRLLPWEVRTGSSLHVTPDEATEAQRTQDAQEGPTGVVVAQDPNSGHFLPF